MHFELRVRVTYRLSSIVKVDKGKNYHLFIIFSAVITVKYLKRPFKGIGVLGILGSATIGTKKVIIDIRLVTNVERRHVSKVG